nr:immunoglobulin light chain junction region [Macaca mulatta]MPN98808.1 immunoglobulin light chain junction region [Macaca mulatta]MPO02933.1 immunoglobulin light chain junction region [Macaca mulatta]
CQQHSKWPQLTV